MTQRLRSFFRSGLGWLLVVGSVPVLAGGLQAASAEEIQAELLSGNYTDAIRDAQAAVQASPQDEDLNELLVHGLLTVGRYEDAERASVAAVGNAPQSLRLRWVAREAARDNGNLDGATAQITAMRQLITNRFNAFRNDPKSLIVFGEFAIELGADPKSVLDQVFTPVQQDHADLREVYLARGKLALDKHDFDLAGQAFQDGLQHFPDDPDMLYGVARAFATSDRKVMLSSLESALKANPRHVPSLLLMADYLITAEDYVGAEKRLDEVKAVNPGEPDAWAYDAVIANLQNRPDDEQSMRAKALQYWNNNPQVDWLIGKKLAEKYRFSEGAAYQRRALASNPDYLPAKSELASDLLRLGQEDEGWQLAQEVNEKDAYDVEAFNLTTLHDVLQKFAVLKDDNFSVRLPQTDAAIYGDQVLTLLNQARSLLEKKYQVEINRPTYINIFDDAKDFAVLTFGEPDVAGYLGVCFGPVVTANGPGATSATPSNWEAVLWHEFTHVVTLQLTRNKMPRWLSEGISVHEERQEDPSWGMRMTPQYRKMVLDDELTPIANLSAAFMAPPTPEYLQFAYFESELVVDYIVQTYGQEALQQILVDLGNGVEINDAIAAHTVAMADLEKGFTAYARGRAENLAPGLTWQEPPAEVLAPGADQDLDAWNRRNPDNYWGMLAQAQRLISQEGWEAAKPILQRLVDLYPTQTGSNSAYPLLANVHRQLGETDQERAILTTYADLDDEATDSYARALTLASDAKDWESVRHLAERYFAVNPLVLLPHRYLAMADEALGDDPGAITANRNLLRLDPPNPVDVHYRLAVLLHRSGDPEARRQVLEALEEAPRFRDALDLLVEINRAEPEPAAPAAPSETPSEASPANPPAAPSATQPADPPDPLPETPAP